MYESMSQKRPRRLTAMDMMGNVTELERENTVQPVVSHDSHRMQGTAQMQRGMPNVLEENINPSYENSRATPSIYTPLQAHGTEPSTRLSRSDPGGVAFNDRRDSLGRVAVNRGEASVYQGSLGPVFEESPINNPLIHPPSAILPSTNPRSSEIRHQQGFGYGNNNPFPTSADPRFLSHPTINQNIYAETYQRPVAFNSVMPHKGSFHPSWQGYEDTPPFSQINNSISDKGFKFNFQPSQEPQPSHMYQQPIPNTAYDAQATGEQADPTLGSKRKKLCNNYHLRGACLVGNACKYVHGVISHAELRELRRIAKGMVCKFGLNCSDELCYAGHKCPFDSSIGHQCHFPDEMHYDGPEETRGRTEMDVNHKSQNEDYHSSLKYELVGPDNQPESSHQEAILDGSSRNLLHRIEQDTSLPIRQRSVNREVIQREVDELIEDIASSKKSLSDSPRANIPPAREITEHDLDLFQQALARSLQGGQTSRSPRQQPGAKEPGFVTTSKTLQAASQRASSSPRKATEQGLDPPHGNGLKRRQQSETSSLVDIKRVKKSLSPDRKHPEHRPKRRSKKRNRHGSSNVRACEYAPRQVREPSPQRVDSWRPNYHPKGDFWRPGDERRNL